MEGYEKITTLGQGGGGAVFLVRNNITKKLLALKKIQLDENKKTRTRQAVEREAKILSQLRHPHIVTYHDSFFQETPDFTFLCIAQDYCDGGNLDERIQTARHRQQHFCEDRVMQWFIQLAMAVQFIHSKKILHRDLKTQNVFLTKSDLVKLGDFGISRTLEHTVDKAKTCVGTPCYLSPELCQDQPYNNKSDVWALGCLLYELCALQPAFDAHNLLSLYYKIVKGDNPILPSRYSENLQELLTTVLEKDPDKRPSATSLLSQEYMQQHLSNFIAEKELLQHQLASTNLNPRPASSPVNRSLDSHQSNATRIRPVSASQHRGRHSIQKQTRCNDKSPRRSRSSLDILPSFVGLPTVDRKKSPAQSPKMAEHRPLEPSESGEYPDDFDSSDEERESSERRIDIECGACLLLPSIGNVVDDEAEVPEECDVSNSDEDIPEELENEEEGEKGSGIDRRDDQAAEKQEEEGDYLSDFEDDEDEETLEDILSNARTVVRVDQEADQGVDQLNNDDSFEDSAILSDSMTTCRQLVADECRDVLGNDIFVEIESKIKENRGKDLDPDQLRSLFEEAVGSERLETCYLLSELLSEVDSTERAETGSTPVL